MGKILDLSQFVGSCLTVALPCGNSIKINKPTERLKIKLMATLEEQIQLTAMEVKGEEIPIERQIGFIDLLEDLIFEILNNNRSQIKFDLEYVKTYFGEIEMINALLLAYREFVEETLSHPN